MPQPAPGSYNPNRPLAKNTLLQYQVKHYSKVEQKLPPEQRTGVDPAVLKTEGEASEYIRKITAALHPLRKKAGG